ncbi:hypothetical protein A3K42_01135 [candidate division WWE3 bacterium RBG_13_37_7]|uniref:Heparinase II/III-like C-terminal domain-containing protein n=1 Tax=candidate division WWE3 bacterium RBG_13_37_7 TaxID=1802609 RepID=A0A1F4U168_UNCKA|nr:MAG: hypothetical protein A3K42_01135 [candidate division WWE3 bacterium RBG_13_37_7]
MNLSIAAFLFFLKKGDYKELIEKYLLAICEEKTWVIPAHEGRLIDLYAADTALTLAEILYILGDNINPKVRNEVIQNINIKVLDPYINNITEHKWYKSSDNWNAVCNSEIAATFLLVKSDSKRKAHAIKTAIEGLQVYLNTSFKPDGSTSEGINYWNYGMSMFVTFSEMLRATTNNQVDLLAHECIKKIASFPSNIQLGLNSFASFSDTNEEDAGTTFNPGIIQRLSERTGEKSLRNLIVDPVKVDWLGISTILRFILWWDGNTNNKYVVNDVLLPDAGIARINSTLKDTTPITLIIKAGNNGENHNHSDIGSFTLNIDGENLLTDPGAGLYNKDYFSEKRYENIFANSFGHSVPIIDNKLQANGTQFYGKITDFEVSTKVKKIRLEMSKAYNTKNLTSLTREVKLTNDIEKMPITIEDNFTFIKETSVIEEAFVTWNEVNINEKTAIINGNKYCAKLTITEPETGVSLTLEKLDKESKENKKKRTLNRICFKIAASTAKVVKFKLNIEVLSKVSIY